MFMIPTPISKTVRTITFPEQGGGKTIINFKGDNLQPVFTDGNNKPIDQGVSIESVVFKSANGNKLNGWIIKSSVSDEPVATTLFCLHGNAGCLLTQYNAFSPMIKHGFQLFIFDYSGFGYSEGNATMQNVLTDALSAFDYAKSRDDIKNTRMVIYGQSLGGHLAAVVAEKKESEIAGLVMEGAFSSHRDIAAHNARQIYIPGFIARLITISDYRATKSIRKYYKPLLVIHSTEDRVIPFYMGKKIFAKANAPKEFYEIKGPHINGPTLYGKEIAQKINAMIGK